MPSHETSDLLSRLQGALGEAYRIDKELGGGGMSRVFLADEVRLGRKVVVKVLPPEMAAGVSISRFEQEIQLAARLQHPHIVPLLTAGASGDLLYYVMPFIEGESLRAKLAREGELPVREAIQILKEVVDALQYAHSHRVVHRDIKPDNVLLSGRHALVTDFGVAKAVSDSTGGMALTSLGVALGTPAYMAPEQAAADPHVDHRADLYAVGAMAYEMITGRPPFTGMSPQAVLAAHITQTPDPVTTHRSTVPPALNELILRCLQKKAADRPQRADELLPHLEALLTPSGGMTPTGTMPVTPVDASATLTQAHPGRVALLFTLAAVGVLTLVYALVQALGLPDWVIYGAAGLLAIGAPIILLTSHQERRRASARAEGVPTTTPVGLQRHMTWRKAILGGGLAFGGLAVIAGLYMLSRVLGIGPGATLQSAGVLKDQERLILADVTNVSSDTTVGETVTELLRIDLAQSSAIQVLQTAQVSDVLERMRRDRDTPLTPEVAAEVAAREGVKAYVAGEVRGVGQGFLVSVRLVEAATGTALISLREVADGPAELIAAVDRLSNQLRERIGESLRTVRADPPLEQLTTASVTALQLYAHASREADKGDYDQAIALLGRSVAADSMFAMAWRRMGMYLSNPARGPDDMTQGRAALERAYGLKDRLSERERLFIEAGYTQRVLQDDERPITAYLAILEKHPADPTALNNLGVSYSLLGRPDEAQRMYWRAIHAGVAVALTYGNQVFNLSFAGKLEEADSALRLFADRYPDSPEIAENTALLALARQDFAAADRTLRTLLAGPPEYQEYGHANLSLIAVAQGRLNEAARERDQALRIRAQRIGMSGDERELIRELAEIEVRAWYGRREPDATTRVERLWATSRRLTASRPATLRHYDSFIRTLARLGEAGRARTLLDEFLAAQATEGRAGNFRKLLNLEREAEVLTAEGKGRDAAARARASCDLIPIAYCLQGYPTRAEAFDLAGEPDSALAQFEGFSDLKARRPDETWVRLAPALRRTGELYEAKGNREKAIEYYGRFVELWKNADPDLQPMVRDVRDRIARLTRETG